jgi:hypothetical protein
MPHIQDRYPEPEVQIPAFVRFPRYRSHATH